MKKVEAFIEMQRKLNEKSNHLLEKINKLNV